MKNKKSLFLLPLVFFAFIFSTCKKQHDPANDFYFSCKINGQTYIPDGCTNCVTCTILADTAFLFGGNVDFDALGIGINDHNNIKVTTYTLDSNINHRGEYKNSTILNDIYITDETHFGQLNITTLDKINKVISGTFYFKAYNAYRNDSVNVTDGKFRWHYVTN